LLTPGGTLLARAAAGWELPAVEGAPVWRAKTIDVLVFARQNEGVAMSSGR
jgi:hypothetical protein